MATAPKPVPEKKKKVEEEPAVRLVDDTPADPSGSTQSGPENPTQGTT
jgi:hypothetical protein